MADLANRLLSGFGSPEGKVAAGLGVLWQNTDPSGSGKVYRKTTASGNTGWVELGAGGGFTPYAAKVQAYNSTTSIAGGTNGPIGFNSAIFDSGSIWDGGTGLAAPVDGLYAFAGSVVFNDTVPVGYQDLSLYVRDPTGGGGGTGPIFAADRVEEPPTHNPGETWGAIAGYANLSAGQKIGLIVENDGPTLVTTRTGTGGGEQVFSGGPVFGMHLAAPA